MQRKQHRRKYAEMHTSISIRQFWFFFLITFVFFLINMNAFDMSENVQFNFLTVYLKKKGYFFFTSTCCIWPCVGKEGAYIFFNLQAFLLLIHMVFNFFRKMYGTSSPQSRLKPLTTWGIMSSVNEVQRNSLHFSQFFSRRKKKTSLRKQQEYFSLFETLCDIQLKNFF